MTEEARMARGAALATAAAAPVALALAWWAAGTKGLLGAAAGGQQDKQGEDDEAWSHLPCVGRAAGPLGR